MLEHLKYNILKLHLYSQAWKGYGEELFMYYSSG